MYQITRKLFPTTFYRFIWNSRNVLTTGIQQTEKRKSLGFPPSSCERQFYHWIQLKEKIAYLLTFFWLLVSVIFWDKFTKFISRWYLSIYHNKTENTYNTCELHTLFYFYVTEAKHMCLVNINVHLIFLLEVFWSALFSSSGIGDVA